MANVGSDDDDRNALDLLVRGFQVSRMLRLVADLGLADKLPKDGSRDVAELASQCSVQAAPLLRVLRALAAFGVFRVDSDGSISHSPRSVLLRTDAPNSLHYGARFWTAPGSWGAWGALDVALGGGNPHQAAWNTSRFQYLREHADEARSFDAFMANFPDRRHQTLAANYDFSKAQLITDVGGGNGEALRQILARFPRPRGLVYLVDMQMMAMFGSARERTEPEFSELLDRSGFVLDGVTRTDSPVWILQAVPA